MAVFATRTGGLQTQTSWAPPRPLAKPQATRDQAIKVAVVSRPVSDLMAATRALVAKEVASGVDTWIRGARGGWAVDTGFSRGRMFAEIDTRGTQIRVRMGNDADYARFTKDAFQLVFDLGTAAINRALDQIERNASGLTNG